jgi:hypothetical protein
MSETGMTISEVCQQMDPVGKIPILFLEDCICSQPDVPNTILMAKKLQNGWCHCVVSSLIKGVRVYHHGHGH